VIRARRETEAVDGGGDERAGFAIEPADTADLRRIEARIPLPGPAGFIFLLLLPGRLAAIAPSGSANWSAWATP